MSLSKVYRGVDAGELKEFHFRSFGEPVAEVKAQEFTATAPQAKPATPPPPAPPAAPAKPDLAVAKQVEEAYVRGRKEGLTEAEGRFATAVQALTRALEDVSRLRESLAQSGSQDMLRLVMAVSEQVIRTTVAADADVVLGIIKNALQASIRADSFRVRINPADFEAVTTQKPLFLASVSGLKNVSFEADPQISQGGCRVDSELGEVDATIETQLEAIRQALSEAIMEG